MTCRILIYAAGASLLLAGCSSRPRAFNPTLAIATADPVGFDSAKAECHSLLVQGKLDSNGRLASAGVGVAAGATVAALGGAAAASAGMYVGAAVASATVVALPFVIIGGAVARAKLKRAKKEKEIQSVMSGCLHEHGYDVAGWTRVKKTTPGTAATVAAN